MAVNAPYQTLREVLFRVRESVWNISSYLKYLFMICILEIAIIVQSHSYNMQCITLFSVQSNEDYSYMLSFYVI